MSSPPPAVAALVDRLAAMPETVALALGGSRALGTADAGSDWDFGLYYRGPIDLAPLAAHGPVFPPGSWGRLMNGGAWLLIDGVKVDVMLRDLDVVEHWTRKAEAGEFERDALLGYLAGAPTYQLAAELASCRVLHGTLPAVNYPHALAASGPVVWRFCRSFSLDYARMLARRGDITGVMGQVSVAVLQEAHARLCARHEWVCNEKRLIASAGLSSVQGLMGAIPAPDAGVRALEDWIDAVAGPLEPPPA